MKGCQEAAIAAFFLVLLQIVPSTNSLPLSTKGSWIVDETGNRVKLTCVNWPSHLEPMLAEGLDKKPLSYIVWQIGASGFNCVRFTYPTYMFTRSNYSTRTVTQSLDMYNLTIAKVGITKNNPQLLNMTVVDVHKAVVDELSKNGIMIVLDNHISLPTWCCSNIDGNGFFGDEYFNPQEWMHGLDMAATRYKNNPWVVGMSLRNEPRGSRQNVSDWYYYMLQGANVIHARNRHALVLISGLKFNADLSFLHNLPVKYNYDNKLVFEMHWYSFGISIEDWTHHTNHICADQLQKHIFNGIFLMTDRDNPYPIFFGEFGIDQTGKDENDNRFMTCLMILMAEYDFDWGLWALQGSYIYREGKRNLDEPYGIMDFNWDAPRNISFIQRLEYLRQINRHAMEDSTTQYVIFHPQSGQCVQVLAGSFNNVILGNCKSATRWKQLSNDEGLVTLANGEQCLAVTGNDAAVSISNNCGGDQSIWKLISASGFQLSSKSEDGEFLCLERNNSDSALVTRKCLCVDDHLEDVAPCPDNPQVQWFKFAPIN